MTLNYSTPVVNPRLGASFAIFASTYTCLVLMLVILEQLGLARATVGQLIVITPALFYVAIGFMTRTINVEDYFISGQRVPALYNAISLCAMVFGGSILLGSIGAIFIAGLDAAALLLGCLAGIALMAVLFGPYLRKAGAYTLPGFFWLRFGQRSVRMTAAILLIAPCLLILAAEISLGAKIAASFLPPPRTFGINIGPQTFFPLLTFGTIYLSVFFGGMRSLTWSQCAQFVVVLGILVPIIIVSIGRTNLPLPQMTYGGQLELLKTEEAAKGMNSTQPEGLAQALPGAGPQALTKPAEEPFVSFSPAEFLMLVLCIAAGVAAHPAFLVRLSTTPNIPAVRRSFGWSMVFAALLVLTLPAYAIFGKAMAVEDLIGTATAEIPAWGQTAQQLGFLGISGNTFDPLAGSAIVTFERDEIAFLLPLAGDLPFVLLGLTAASAIAAIAACAGGQLLAIGNAISDDIYLGGIHKTATPSRRLFISRVTMLGFGLVTLHFLSGQTIDPLRYVLWALSLSAGTFFAVLVLSIWWKRLSSAGAMGGMIAGFCVTALTIQGSQETPLFFGIDSFTAPVIGVPISLGVAVLMSTVFQTADETAFERVEELRVPAGETILARVTRLGSRGKAGR